MWALLSVMSRENMKYSLEDVIPSVVTEFSPFEGERGGLYIDFV